MSSGTISQTPQVKSHLGKTGFYRILGSSPDVLIDPPQRKTCMATGVKTFALSSLDIDECIESPDVCHQHAVCSNSDGSYSCECERGYFGDGKVNCSGTVELTILLLYIIIEKHVECLLPVKFPNLRGKSPIFNFFFLSSIKVTLMYYSNPQTSECFPETL